MPAPDPLAPFLDPLERLGLPYCITGSVAASVYGARSTARLGARQPATHQRGGSSLWIAPREYVILRKPEYLREGGQDKHVRDIRFMLAATDVDRKFLDSEIARLGLQAQWRRCGRDGQG